MVLQQLSVPSNCLNRRRKFQPQQIATLSWVAGTGYAIAGQHRPAIDYLEHAEQIYERT